MIKAFDQEGKPYTFDSKTKLVIRCTNKKYKALFGTNNKFEDEYSFTLENDSGVPCELILESAPTNATSVPVAVYIGRKIVARINVRICKKPPPKPPKFHHFDVVLSSDKQCLGIGEYGRQLRITAKDKDGNPVILEDDVLINRISRTNVTFGEDNSPQYKFNFAGRSEYLCDVRLEPSNLDKLGGIFTVGVSIADNEKVFKSDVMICKEPIRYGNELTISLKDSISKDNKGVVIDFGATPQVIEGRTMIPIRHIARWLGAEVEWRKETKAITCRIKSNEIKMFIGKITAIINGRPVEMKVAPTDINGQTFIPLRFFVESFQATTSWDSETRSITIRKSGGGLG